MNLIRITNAQRKWYEIILWWELRRIPYNIIMYFVGLLSFYISYMTIPLIYLLIGFLLNICYTGGWIYELMFVTQQSIEKRKHYPGHAFLTYLILSTFLVLIVAVLPVILLYVTR